jgi:hypothetical protein
MTTPETTKVLETDDDNSNDYTSDDGGIYPYSKDVDLSSIEINLRDDKISVFEIIRRTAKGNFIFDPEFQRSPNAWNKDKKSMFIESLILNLPLPPFYLNKNKESKYIVIDGLQRLTAILDFFAGKFKLEGLKALPWLNGFDFGMLENEYAQVLSKIEDKNIPFYTIMPSVPMAVTYDIFRRINTGGTSLERQEIRNCIYIGPSTRLLKRLSENEVFRKVIDEGISSKRMKDRESILRCLAFSSKSNIEDYESNLDDYLSNKMKDINNYNDDEINELENRFLKIMEVIFVVFDKNAFRLPSKGNRGVINIAVMESIYNAFARYELDAIKNNKNKVIIAFQNLIQNSDYLESVKTSTNSIKKVKARFRIANQYIGECLC